MISEHVVFVLVLATLIHQLLFWMVSRPIQPLRLAIASLGERLLLDTSLGAPYRHRIRFVLDHAYDFWIMPLTMAAIPAAFCMVISKKDKNKIEIADDGMREDYRTLISLFGPSVLAANPLFGAIVLVEFTIFAIFLWIIYTDSAVLNWLALDILELESRVLKDVETDASIDT